MRIVGGTEAGPNEFPWQAHLYRQAASGRGTESFCGGSIISSRLILTAAHCFFDENGAPTHRRSHSISVGTNTAFDWGNMVEVDSITVHSGYTPNELGGTGENDVAMMILRSPLTFSREVSPVCLPRARTDFAGRTGTVTGFGMLSDQGQVSDVLMKVDVPIMSEQTCRNSWRYRSPFDPTTEICARGDRGKDSCGGDSGGPLVVESSGHADLVGVVSFGGECGNSRVAVYAKVQAFLPWINNFMSGSQGGRTCPR